LRKVDISSVKKLPQKTPTTRGYSDEVKEKVLADVMISNDPFGVAKRTQIPYPTVRKWVRESIKAPVLDAIRQQECKTFIKDAWGTITKCLTVIDDKVKDATAKDAAVVIGILVDKILRSSASITVTRETAEEVSNLEHLPDELLDKLIDAVRARDGAQQAAIDTEPVDAELVESEEDEKK